MLLAFRCIIFARKWKNSSKNNASIYFCETEPSELGGKGSDFDRIRSKPCFIKRPCITDWCAPIFSDLPPALHCVNPFCELTEVHAYLFFKEYTYPDLRIYKDLKFDNSRCRTVNVFDVSEIT